MACNGQDCQKTKYQIKDPTSITVVAIDSFKAGPETKELIRKYEELWRAAIMAALAAIESDGVPTVPCEDKTCECKKVKEDDNWSDPPPQPSLPGPQGKTIPKPLPKGYTEPLSTPWQEADGTKHDVTWVAKAKRKVVYGICVTPKGK